MADISLKLKYNHLSNPATRRAAADTFGLSDACMHEAVRRGAILSVKATDAQFGQFIALRCIYGCGNNVIQDLEPTMIVDPRPCRDTLFQTEFDVRGRRC